MRNLRPNTALLFVFVLALFAVLLLACSPPGTPSPTAPPEPPLQTLEKTRWALTSLKGANPVAGSEFTLAFYPDQYTEGKAGCNHYGVDYTLEQDTFQFQTIHQTHTACTEPGMAEQEADYFAALGEVAAYGATEEQLVFDDAQGRTILVFSRVHPPSTGSILPGTAWELVSLEGQPPLPGTYISLEFEARSVGGTAGCNFYGLGAEADNYAATDDGVLSFLEMSSTLMLCSEEVMAQESAYLGTLQRSTSYQVLENRLELRDEAGNTLLVYERRGECAQALPDLSGTSWQLVSVDGIATGEAEALLTFFDEHWYIDSTRCVAYLSTYQITGAAIRSSFTTLLAQTCQREDDPWDELLENPRHICLAGDRLEITTIRGKEHIYQPLAPASPPSLEGAAWALLAIVGRRQIEGEPLPLPDPFPVRERTQVSLSLADGQASGSAGCNTYQAAYTLAGTGISFAAVGATKKSCTSPEQVMEQEQRYLAALATVTGYRFAGDQLWLQTSAAEYLVFTR